MFLQYPRSLGGWCKMRVEKARELAQIAQTHARICIRNRGAPVGGSMAVHLENKRGIALSF
jgi:hypothetical protein